MLSHGDEIGRTQRGNNNAYAQDNELSWMHWNELDEWRQQLLAFTRKCFNLRHTHAVLRRRHFFRGEPTIKGGRKDLSWIRLDGQEMTDGDWQRAESHSLGMLIYGDATDETDDRGRPIKGETLLLLLNGGDAEVAFTMPTIEGHGIWAEMVDTARRELRVISTGCVKLDPYSLVLLRYGENRRMSDSADPSNVSGNITHREEHG
jgi:glycogen operon protein